MRFVRTNTQKQQVVEIKEIPSIKKSSETAFNLEETPEITEYETTPAQPADFELDESIDEESMQYIESIPQSLPKSAQDSTTISREKADDITEQALRAEKQGKISLTLSIVMISLLVLSAAALIFAVFEGGGSISLLVALVIAASIALILSVIFGIISLAAPYNTNSGRKNAIIALVICGIPLLYFLVGVVLSI